MESVYGVTVMANPAAVSQPQAVTMRDANQWNTLFHTGRESSSGMKVTHKSVIGYPPFWRGVNLLANGVACLPLDVFRRRAGGDREVDSRHPAQRICKMEASPIVSAERLRKTMTGQALTFGNSFAWIERALAGNLGDPVALWLLDPENMIVRYVDDDLWYCTTIDGQQAKFPSRDIVHIPNLTHNGICGYSSLDIFADALGVGMAAQQFGGKFFANGANMSGVLMFPHAFNEEKLRNAMGDWKEMNEGLQNAHKIALLQDGVKFQPVSVAPEQGQFLETRSFDIRGVVANILGVPPHLLGDDSRVSYSSLEAENKSYLNHSLNPWLKEFEAEFSRKLLRTNERERGSRFIEFNREAAVQMDFQARAEGIRTQIETGVLSVNEARKLQNLPGIGEDGDKRYHPANWMEVGQQQMEPEPQPAPEPQPEEGQEQNVLRAMIESSVTAGMNSERRRVLDMSKKADFLNKADKFYVTWTENTVSALKGEDVVAAKQAHAEESRRQLEQVVNSSTADTLQANVADVVATWEDRGKQLTEIIYKAVTCDSKE